MSAVDRRTTTTVRHEYLVRNPAPHADVQEALLFAKRDAAAAGQDTSYDDALWVTHNDDNIIVYWEEVTR